MTFDHSLSRYTPLPLIIALSASVLTAAPSPAHAAEATSNEQATAAAAQKIVWTGCPESTASDKARRNLLRFKREARQQCATLTVPLDYANPTGRTIKLTISRLPASEPKSRSGVLLINPGGPGGAGLDMPSYYRGKLSSDILAHYDLIGFDPRGVENSTPVTCGLSNKTAADLLIPFPDSTGSIDANIAFARKTAADCQKRSGDLLPFINTTAIARDMDTIRIALGESKLSYLGISYGTYLGAVYGELFPQQVDRMILDSAVDPTSVGERFWTGISEAMASRFPDMAAFAAKRHSQYGLGDTPKKVTDSYLALASSLDSHPVKTPTIVVNGNVLRLVTWNLLAAEDHLPALAQTWKELAEAVRAGDQTTPTAIEAPTSAAGLLGLASLGAGAGAGSPTDNGYAAMYAIMCSDGPWSTSTAHYQKAVTADRKAWPLSGGMPANIWPCAFWPAQAKQPVAISSTGERNILLLQNRRDPATGWKSGMGMRKALGSRAALVSVNAGGHGVLGNGSCADKHAATFLVSGKLPAADLSC